MGFKTERGVVGVVNLEVILSENQIEALINGETISTRVANGHVVDIRQSYLKDAATPMLRRRNKVVDTDVNAVINKHFASMLEDSYYRDGE